MNTVQVFEHPELDEIRVVEIDGAPWFVGKDIAAALGYGNPRDALSKHIDEEDKSSSQIPTSSGTQKMTVINENGFYSLAFSSKLPNAKQVKNWIARDVLPILREHNNPAADDDNILKSLVNAPDMDENHSYMSEFVPIEREGTRVLLTSQLAEAYEITAAIISKNFTRNKERYTADKHYFLLESDALKKFKMTNSQFDDSSIHINKLFWTERGALLHAKSLNTDRTWEVYDYLVETYFRMKEVPHYDADVFSRNQFDISALSPSLQMATTLLKNANILLETMVRTELEQKRQAEEQVRQAAEQERIVQEQERQAAEQKRQAQEQEQHTEALKMVDRKLEDIQDIVVIHPETWRRDCHRLVAAIAQKRGGNSKAYQDTNTEIFKLVDQRAHVSLKRRLKNRRDRMAKMGLSKSKQDKVNQMDIIEEDGKLTEIYIAIVKEMCVKYEVSPSVLDEAQSA